MQDDETTTDEGDELWMKVLGPDGESIKRGDLEWSLPTEQEDGSWEPGDWHEVEGKIRLCRNGLHLTRKPGNWYQEGAEVWVAEYEGDTDATGSDKMAVRRARLLRPATADEAGVYLEGEHQFQEGKVWAGGSASVEAWGSASVEADGRATTVQTDSRVAYSASSALAVLVDRTSRPPSTLVGVTQGAES